MNNHYSSFLRSPRKDIQNLFDELADLKKLNGITDLLNRKAELEAKDSNFMQYVNYGFSLLKNLDKYYLKSNIAVKQKIISSIFPEKLIYQDKKYRTTEINEALSLLTNNINRLGLPINRKAIISNGSSYKALPVDEISNNLLVVFKKLVYCF